MTEFLSGYDSPEMDMIVIAHAQKAKEKYEMILENAKTCFDDSGKIRHVRLHYSSQQIIELEEARDQLVFVVDGLLEKINSNPIVNTMLLHRPFTSKDLEVHITYESYYGLHVDPNKVAHTIEEQGVSFFYNAELDGRNSDYWGKRIEPYFKTRRFSHYYEMFRPHEEEDLKLESFDEFRFRPPREGVMIE